MKRPLLSVMVGLLGCLTLALGGCPLDPMAISPETFEPLPAIPGLYWAEHTDGELAIYRLPEYREDPGSWTTHEIDPPDWYTGPAVYELDDVGDWTRVTEGDDLTLDEIMQLYDFAPAAP
ncbi:MAG: hypothetical protein PVJ57_11740 [Phycisphaerae bacterium]|jgi:hypothetical protein